MTGNLFVRSIIPPIAKCTEKEERKQKKKREEGGNASALLSPAFKFVHASRLIARVRVLICVNLPVFRGKVFLSPSKYPLLSVHRCSRARCSYVRRLYTWQVCARSREKKNDERTVRCWIPRVKENSSGTTFDVSKLRRTKMKVLTDARLISIAPRNFLSRRARSRRMAVVS